MTEVIIAFSCVVAAVLIIAQFPLRDPCVCRTKKPANICLALLVLPATAFLWVPWVAFGVTTIDRINKGAINDLSKPEIVLPAPDETRPSKAHKEGK